MAAEGLTYEAVAARVRAQGAKQVKYQHIQQLVQFPNRVPKYLLELAKAFGYTAEEFAELAQGGLGVRDSDGIRYAPLSPSVRTSLAKMEDAVALLKRMAAARDWPETAHTDPLLLWIAQETVATSDDRLNETNLISFMQRFNAQLKAHGERHGDERGAIGSLGAPDAGEGKSARKAAK